MLEIVKAFLKPPGLNFTPQAGSVRGDFYERTGQCNMCGKCCSNIYLVYGQQTIDTPELFAEIRANNPEYAYFKPIEQAEDGLLFQCVHLQADNSCGIYANRPDFCRRYPSEQSLLMGGKLADGCGYSFRLLKTFGDVLRETAEKPTINPGRLLS